MAVQDTSKKALDNTQKSLGNKQQIIFEALLEIGPSHNNRILEYLNQKESLKPRGQRKFWQINQVCGRINELINEKQIVRDLGPHRGFWHGQSKTYHIWAVIGENQNPFGWVPVPKENSRLRKSHAEIRAGLKEVRAKVEKRILQKSLFA
jgi:hypothetical protein